MIPVEHIHPMIVHFPIVLVFIMVAFDLLATVFGYSVSGRTACGNVSTGLAVLAAISAVIAFVFGGLALDHAEAAGFSSEVAEIHESLGGYVAMALVAWAVIRAVFWFRDWRVVGGQALVFPAVAIAGAVLVSATAYYGGQLVFDLGVNVARTFPAG